MQKFARFNPKTKELWKSKFHACKLNSILHATLLCLFRRTFRCDVTGVELTSKHIYSYVPKSVLCTSKRDIQKHYWRSLLFSTHFVGTLLKLRSNNKRPLGLGNNFLVHMLRNENIIKKLYKDTRRTGAKKGMHIRGNEAKIM